MVSKIRDTIARALLPAWLASLALLLMPIGLDSTCTHLHSIKARIFQAELGHLEYRAASRVETLVNWVEAHGRTVHQHFVMLGSLLLAATLAYLVFARERWMVRVSVIAVLLLLVLAQTLLFGSIC
jgi:hypothetical protein